MSGMKSWSTTAASNVLANTGFTMDEGMAPSAVNDSVRQLMADVRTEWYQGANVASATTVDLSAVTGGYIHITGTTTITGFGTVDKGIRRRVVFDGALTLTHNATSLILPGGASITTAAGDTATFVSEGSGNWRCTDYAGKNANFSTINVTGGSTLAAVNASGSLSLTGTVTHYIKEGCALAATSTGTVGGTVRGQLSWNSSGSVLIAVGATPINAITATSLGVVGFSQYGAGTLSTDASGNITASSDERIKTNIRPFTRSREAIRALMPILHGYTVESGLDQTRDDYAGFSAQNAQKAIPESVGRNKDGSLSLLDRAILATLVNAFNDLESEFDAYKLAHP